jgi:hypothetical protein
MRVDLRHVHRPSPSDLTTGSAGFGTVGEPSVAIVEDQVLLTGNWYAARSLDRGSTWDALDPYDYLVPGAATAFCCDQTVYRDAAHDLTFWLLQYAKSATDNTLRVAVKSGATLDDDDWIWWDLSPTMFDATWTKEWFDYNHMSSSDEYVFIGTNVLGLGGKSVFRSLVLRISFTSIIDGIANGTPLDIELLEDDHAGTLHCVQGATDTMYIAGQIGTDTIRLYRWPDADASATNVDIAVSPWNDSDYSAPGPDGNNWVQRADDRITGGWFSGGNVGLMWTSGRLNTNRPLPYVRVAVIDPTTSTVVSERDIWSADVAYAWPSAAPNANGEIGVTMFRGGGLKNPGHVVGGWDEAAGAWVLTIAVDGTNGPKDRKWGDYVTCCSAGETWFAAAYTLQGGQTLEYIAPDVVEFALV